MATIDSTVEELVIAAIAAGKTKELAESGLSPYWLPDDSDARSVYEAAMSLLASDKDVNLTNLMALTVKDVDWKRWTPSWLMFTKANVDPSLVTNEVKSEYIKRLYLRLADEAKTAILSKNGTFIPWLSDRLMTLQEAIAGSDIRTGLPTKLISDYTPRKPILKTGISGIDRAFGDGAGLHSSDMIIVAAPTGHGKSTLAYTIAAAAVVNGVKCLIVSSEQTAPEVVVRILNAIGFTNKEIMEKKGSTKERDELLQSYISPLGSSSLSRIDTLLRVYELVNMTPDTIATIARMFGAKVVIVDHLTHMAVLGNTSVRQNNGMWFETGKLAYRFSEIARDTNSVYIVFSQLSARDQEKVANGDVDKISGGYGSSMVMQAASFFVVLVKGKGSTSTSTLHVLKDRPYGTYHVEYSLYYDIRRKAFAPDNLVAEEAFR